MRLAHRSPDQPHGRPRGPRSSGQGPANEGVERATPARAAPTSPADKCASTDVSTVVKSKRTPPSSVRPFESASRCRLDADVLYRSPAHSSQDASRASTSIPPPPLAHHLGLRRVLWPDRRPTSSVGSVTARQAPATRCTSRRRSSWPERVLWPPESATWPTPARRPAAPVELRLRPARARLDPGRDARPVDADLPARRRLLCAAGARPLQGAGGGADGAPGPARQVSRRDARRTGRLHLVGARRPSPRSSRRRAAFLDRRRPAVVGRHLTRRPAPASPNPVDDPFLFFRRNVAHRFCSLARRPLGCPSLAAVAGTASLVRRRLLDRGRQNGRRRTLSGRRIAVAAACRTPAAGACL